MSEKFIDLKKILISKQTKTDFGIYKLLNTRNAELLSFFDRNKTVLNSKNIVYEHLVTFFSRYYSNGIFLPDTQSICLWSEYKDKNHRFLDFNCYYAGSYKDYSGAKNKKHENNAKTVSSAREKTFDYFIHKNSKEFLNRELDFYLKSEVINFDEKSLKKSLKIIKDVKITAQGIINILGKYEDIQKELWLKKKSVTSFEYCITLDKIDECFFQEIVDNKKQIEEWENLFFISGIQAESNILSGKVLTKGTDITQKVEFLKQNRSLVLDTSFFSKDFKDRLIKSIGLTDEHLNGILINSDNFQALNFLYDEYKNRVRCVYIDPPYNTCKESFIYKDNYKDISWAVMFTDRIKALIPHLEENGCVITHIDENEISNTLKIFQLLFGKENVEVAIWRKTGRQSNTKRINRMKVTHEYLVFGYKNKKSVSFKKIKELPQWENQYTNPDNDVRGNYKQGIISNKEEKSRPQKPNYYSIATPSGRVYTREWYISKEQFEEYLDDNRIYFPKNGDGVPTLKIFENEENDYYFDSVCDRFGTFTQAREEYGDVMGDCPNTLTPKTIKVGKELIRLSTEPNSIVYDIFGGSGTSYISNLLLCEEEKEILRHKITVCSNIQRKERYKQQLKETGRRFVLVEKGEFFHAITKPRILKTIYSREWKKGKPIKRTGFSHIFKYINIESFDDCIDLHCKRFLSC